MASVAPSLPPPLPPIPVTVVTGFLGAGKTTLLRGLVQRRQSRRLALLINEFGEVAIDGDLLRAEGDAQGHVQIQDFAHGLIAYGDDEHFVPAMLALAARRAQIDHVLIETSGLALPSAVMEVLQSPELAPHFVLDATLAVVDTPLLLEEAFASGDTVRRDGQLFRQQLECADVVVLNKIDGMEEAPLLQAEETVRALAPMCASWSWPMGRGWTSAWHWACACTRRAAPCITITRRWPCPANAPPWQRTSGASTAMRTPGWVRTAAAVHPQAFPRAGPRLAILHAAQPDSARAEALRRAVVAVALDQPILRTKGFIATGAGSCTGCCPACVASWPGAQGGTSAGRSELVFIGYHPSRAVWRSCSIDRHRLDLIFLQYQETTSP
jgi:cobalamin biosynthesis protein CobW